LLREHNFDFTLQSQKRAIDTPFYVHKPRIAVPANLQLSTKIHTLPYMKNFAHLGAKCRDAAIASREIGVMKSKF
jgi:hypothetical protein